MDWNTIQRLLVNWFASITGIPVDHVVWAGQNIERPNYPYAVLNILSDESIGADETFYVDAGDGTLTSTVSGLREFVISFRVHANSQKPSEHAQAYLSKVELGLSRGSTVELFSLNNLAIVTNSPTVVNLSDVRNLGMTSAAAFDLRLATTAIDTPETGQATIDKANVSGTITSPHTVTIPPRDYGNT
jgi:hypothetical protein